MATVYKIEIETTSPWVAYTRESLSAIIEDIFKNERELRSFENTKIKVNLK